MKYLPKNIINKCIEVYEKNNLFLNKTPYYYEEKKKLFEPKVSCEKFSNFINNTKGSKFTSFNTTTTKNIKRTIYNKDHMIYDIFINKYLFIKPNFWQENCVKDLKKYY